MGLGSRYSHLFRPYTVLRKHEYKRRVQCIALQSDEKTNIVHLILFSPSPFKAQCVCCSMCIAIGKWSKLYLIDAVLQLANVALIRE